MSEEDLNQLYTIFESYGIEKKTLKGWIDNLELDKGRRTESIIINLFLCLGIEKGLDIKHLKVLSEKLGHKQFRAHHLSQRIKFLKENIVKK